MITSALFWVAVATAAAAYWLVPRYRDWSLLVSSALFVGWTDWRSLVAVLVLGSLSYRVGRKAATLPKWVVGLAVVAALAFLAYYKYAPPLREAIFGAAASKTPKVGTTEGVMTVVPLGASYFTFKLVHYLVDSRREQLPRHDFKTFLGYLFFLPMFTAGPIERFDDYLSNRSSTLTKEHIAEGGSRILYGLVKKMVVVDIFLSNRRGFIPSSLLDAVPFWRPPCTVEALLKNADTVHPLFVWQFVIHRFTAWYLDFSAYSDIAIGVALFFGIRLTENFDWPLLAPNPTAFWKRYHASLSAWCQRYVYLPVMGRARNPYIALYATMITMGLWHAGNLNYVAWGLYQATLVALYLTWNRIKRWRKWKLKSRVLLVFGTIVTLLLTSASSVFASTSDQGIRAAFRLLGALVGIHT